MPNYNLLKGLLGAAEREVPVAERTIYNKSALEALKRQRDLESQLAGELAAGTDAPLKVNPFESGLSNIDKSKLPSNEPIPPNFELVGNPQDKGFILGEAGEISRPPVAYKAPASANLDNSLPDIIPGKSDFSGETIDISPEALQSRWQKYKGMALPAAGAAAAGTYFGLQSGDMGGKVAQSAPQVPPPNVPSAIQEPVSEEEKELNKQVAKLAVPSASEKDAVAPVTPIQFGQDNIANLAKLQELHKQMNQAQATNEMGRIGAAMATGMSGVKNNFDPIFDDRAKRIAGVPDQYVKEVDFQKDDPNSSISQGYRSLAASMGFPVSGVASARDIDKQFPQIANIYNQREAQAARKDIARDNREARLQELQMSLASMKDIKKAQKDDKNDRFIQSLRKETTTGPLGKMSSNYHTAMRMTDSLQQFAKDPSGYSDYATLMGGLKSLQGDDSVVKEAEIRLGMNAASLGDKITNWADHLITGRSLRPDQRAEMIKTVRILSETARRQYKDAIHPILQQASQVGIDPKLIINEDIIAPNKDMDNFKKETKRALQESVKNPSRKYVVKKGYNAKTNQTQLIYSDGSKEIVDGRQ